MSSSYNRITARVLAKAWVLLLAGTTIATSTVGCDGEAREQLSQAERDIVAQRYADSIRAISGRTDSLCLLDRPALVTHLADSLVELRLADIERQQSATQQ